MIIKERTMNGLPVVSLSGKLDIFSKNAFKETAEKYTDSNSKGLILDFQGVTLLDSVGLGALAVLARTFLKLKGADDYRESPGSGEDTIMRNAYGEDDPHVYNG